MHLLFPLMNSGRREIGWPESSAAAATRKIPVTPPGPTSAWPVWRGGGSGQFKAQASIGQRLIFRSSHSAHLFQGRPESICML